MDYVFVLEDDPVHRREITDTLKKIQDNFEIKVFESLDEFSSMVKSIMTHGALALAKDDREAVRVVLVVARIEFIGFERLGLLEKTREFFIRQGVCTVEEPTRFVLTAFDDPHFKFEQLKKPIVSNIIFKPFDKLILQQHLLLAMPQVKSGEDALTSQKASASVEMLKSVDMEAMTELGFSSISNRTFETGAVNKYYGKDFAVDQQRSVMARLASCHPVPGKQESYKLDFRFFAMDPAQIANIRKKVRSKDHGTPREIRPMFPTQSGKAPGKPFFVVISANEEEARSLTGTLTRKISGAEVAVFRTKKEFEDDMVFSDKAATSIFSVPSVTAEIQPQNLIVQKIEPEDATMWGESMKSVTLTRYFSKEDGQMLGLWLMGSKQDLKMRTTYNGKYASLKFTRSGNRVTITELQGTERAEFLKSFRQAKHPISAVFAESRELDLDHPTAWENFIKALEEDQGQRPPIYMLANRDYTDEEERVMAKYVDDLFYQPWDRIYLLQKLIFEIPGLKILEDPVTVAEKKSPQSIRAANPVKIEEISEAILVLQYYRALEPASFREFVLWQPYDISAPELCGVVHSVDAEADDKNPAKIRFTFFGVRDHQLKAIRLWILNNYIQGKEKG